jgi:hypothetical protein
MTHPQAQLWSLAYSLRELCWAEVVEEQTLYEGTSISYSHLVEGVREMFLHGVLGDVEGL